VFIARYSLSPYIKQICFVKKMLVTLLYEMSNLYGGDSTLAVRMKNYGRNNNCIQNFIREYNVLD
jgi:hypothetical protein